MYNSTLTNSDKKEYVALNQRLKAENRETKRIMCSKEIRVGTHLFNVISMLKGSTKFTEGVKKIGSSIRWKNLCRKYPIKRVSDDTRLVECNYFSDEKIVIYTAIFGNYDIPQEPVIVPDNCEFVLISDQKIADNSAWKRLDPNKVIPNYMELTNAERNRFCKMFPHKIFQDIRYTIYIDGNIKVVSDLTEFVNHDFRHGMQFHKHKSRNCVYEEMEACRILKKAQKSAIESYSRVLQRRGFPAQYGMAECNVIVRDSSVNKMKIIMEMWWNEFRNNEVKRDQLSLPYLLWQNGIPVDEVTALGENVEDNHAIRVVSHQ